MGWIHLAFIFYFYFLDLFLGLSIVENVISLSLSLFCV